MSGGLYVLVRCAVLFVDIISLLMMLRALLSWLFIDRESKFGAFLYVVTEPVIMPIRALCERFGWFRGMPMDMPFFITAVLLLVASLFLETAIGF